LPANPVPTGIQRTFYNLAIMMMVIAALYWGRPVLLPLALSTLFAFILTPAVSALERHHFHRLPAVLLVTILVFGILIGLGYGLTIQMGQFADTLPQYTDTIKHKIDALRGSGSGTIGRLIGMFNELTGSINEVNTAAKQTGTKPELPGIDFQWVTGFAGSAAELLATIALVIVLAIFILVRREDLRDRVIRLFSRGHLTATTRALDEAAQLISRYLSMLVLVNASVGVVLSIGLFLIGIPFALLWGFLVAALRFIPYIGVWIGAVFPIILSVAIGPGWMQPLMVVSLVLVLELIVANAIEPVLYGRSMGVSEVALLVSAAFWAWLWGPVGLLLSVPMTVCVAVLGKYVPQLEFFSILLRDQPVLALPVRYYQRLLAHDEDEAGEMVEEYLRDHPWEKVFDEVLMPALALARRDQERDELGPGEQQLIYQTTREVLDDLVLRQEQISKIASVPVGEEPPQRSVVSALGFSAHDDADELTLHMLAELLEPSDCRLEVFSSRSLTAEVLQRACEDQPAFVVIAALPPGGLARTRNLCKRLRAQCPQMKIFVIRWGHHKENSEGWRQLGADGVATTLQEAGTLLIPLVQTAAHASTDQPTEARETVSAAT